VINSPAISTALVGTSSVEQLEQAVEYASKGALPSRALEEIREVWSSERLRHL